LIGVVNDGVKDAEGKKRNPVIMETWLVVTSSSRRSEINSIVVEVSMAHWRAHWRASPFGGFEIKHDGYATKVLKDTKEGEGILLNDRMTSDKNCDHEPSTGRY
jgi:hypothetical protein